VPSFQHEQLRADRPCRARLVDQLARHVVATGFEGAARHAHRPRWGRCPGPLVDRQRLVPTALRDQSAGKRIGGGIPRCG
jgi:hypothetical protein